MDAKTKITPLVAREAVKKTWSFVCMMLPVRLLSAVAAELASFFQQEEQNWKGR